MLAATTIAARAQRYMVFIQWLLKWNEAPSLPCGYHG